jgi:hypothetical protein
MARRPKNPINDIVDTVGGWLGGRGPGTNPQVRAAMDATRAVGKVVDTATGGFGSALISDAQRMAQSGSSTPSALYKTAAVNLGAAATGVGAAKVAGKVVSNVGRTVANKVLPAEIGVHHSIAMKGQPFTGTVRASKAGRSLTAMDQQAGQSYFWSTQGKGGASKAAQEVKFQTEEIGFKYVDFPDESTAVGYVTKVPRNVAKVDPNLPGSTARQVPGGTQKVVKSVSGTGKPYYAVAKSFTDADAARLANAVRVAKSVEVAKSAAKIGGAAAGVAGVAAGVKKKGRGGGKNKK